MRDLEVKIVEIKGNCPVYKEGKHIPVIFPIYPRTSKQIEIFGFQQYFVNLANNESPITSNGVYLMDPLGYLDFLNLEANARFV